MNAAEKLMMVKGLIAGLQAAEAALKDEVLGINDEFGAKSFATKLGSASVIKPDPKVAVSDEAGLLAWVEERFPSEVETVRRVRPKSREVLLGQLIIDGLDVIDAAGEVVPWASVETGAEYVRATLDKQVKADAAVHVAAELERLLGVTQIGSGL